MLHECYKLLLLVVLIVFIAFHVIYSHRHWRLVSQILGSNRNLRSSLSNETGDQETEREFDVHCEHQVLGHTGEVSDGSHSTRTAKINVTTIAIAGAITSKGLRGVNASNIAAKFQFFHTFLPTFCKTASPGYDYRFYLAYDSTDPVFSEAGLLAAFQRTFIDEMRLLCDDPPKFRSSIHMVQCNHTDKPSWAQNDAVLEAYLDHVDYFYRVNDDTRMETGGWTEAFIAALDRYSPPVVGVVGPNHTGGNIAILTYEFVHRTHVDIFGFYYPRLFTDWWGDYWMTFVYSPERSIKLSNIRLAHTKALGRRYQIDKSIRERLDGQLVRGIRIVNRYMEAVKSNNASGVKSDGRKVISMTLYGKEPRYTWGVIRNAQLVPVNLPEWTLRVYIAADPAPTELAVPPRITNKLRLLGAEVVHISAATGNCMAPRDWRLLAADDQRLDYFLVRDADSRLSDREASAVRDWISTAEKNGPRSGVVHCVRDHPKHANRAIVDGLWGGRPRPLRQVLNKPLASFLGLTTASSTASKLSAVLWPAVAASAYCHDSVSLCDQWTPLTSRHQFPSHRDGQEYLGQKFDEHQELYSKDDNQLQSDVVCPVASEEFHANYSTLRPAE